MKVLLVSPPTSHILNEVISLGLLSIATVLHKSGHEVKIVDANARNRLMNNAQVIDEIRRYNPDVIGINLMTPFVPNCYKLITELKPLGKVLVAGGPHATLIPQEVLEYGFDIAVRGEGEVTVPELLRKLESNQSLDNVLGISFKGLGGVIVHNPDRPLIEDLDALPFPDYSLLDLRNYSMDNNTSLRIFSVLTSRSCPSQCIYCANARLFRGKYRTRSAENIFAEIMQLKSKYDVRYIRFVDDALTIKKDRIYKLMDFMKSAPELKGLRWECDSRVDAVDVNLLTQMKNAGCDAVIYGVESYDDESLRMMKKGITTDKIDAALEASKKVGIFFNINIIIGFPWENVSHIENTLRLSRIDYNRCQYPCGIPIPWPGTGLYEQYKERFGFSQWWLNERNFSDPYFYGPRKGQYKPFFSPRFIGINNVTATKKNMDLWRMSKDMRWVLFSALFKFSGRSLTNIHGKRKGIILYWLSRISLFLFSVNPVLELFVFSILKRMRRIMGAFKRLRLTNCLLKAS